MKGYELLKKIADGEIKEGANIIVEKLGYEKFIFYKNGILEVPRNGGKDRIKLTEDNSIKDIIEAEYRVVQESKWWEPKTEEHYWLADSVGNILSTINNGREQDKFRISTGNCYKTKEECERAIERQQILTQLRKFAVEHNEGEIDWNNINQPKFCNFYNYFYKSISTISTNIGQDIGQIYFTSKDIAEQVIAEIGEDNIRKLFEV